MKSHHVGVCICYYYYYCINCLLGFEAGRTGLGLVHAFQVVRLSSSRLSFQTFEATTDEANTNTIEANEANQPIDIDSTSTANDQLARCLSVLNRAAETKQEDTETVLKALLKLEELSRLAGKREREQERIGTTGKNGDGDSGSSTDNGQNLRSVVDGVESTTSSLASSHVAQQLDGSWRLVFTTGTVSTQKRLSGQRINYFPIKAIQSFNTTSMNIANGIYIGDFAVLQFRGTYDFNTTRRKVEFDFDSVSLFNNAFTIQLQNGQAAQLGAASGLGSESNMALTKQKKLPFFNWISADSTIATARGGGGGLALWKRV